MKSILRGIIAVPALTSIDFLVARKIVMMILESGRDQCIYLYFLSVTVIVSEDSARLENLPCSLPLQWSLGGGYSAAVSSLPLGRTTTASQARSSSRLTLCEVVVLSRLSLAQVGIHSLNFEPSHSPAFNRLWSLRRISRAFQSYIGTAPEARMRSVHAFEHQCRENGFSNRCGPKMF